MCVRLTFSQERVRALDLQPLRASRARIVRCLERFHHHAFVAAGDGIVVERLRRGGVAGDEARRQHARGQNLGHGFEADARGLADEVGVAATQAVEKEHRQWHLRAKRVDVERAAEAAHRVLERVGRAVGTKRDGLAVQDERLARRVGDAAHDLRRGGRDVVAGARVDAHGVAFAMHLHARTVELPFESGHRDAGEGVAQVVGRLREHRRERLEHSNRKAPQARCAFGQRRGCDRAYSTGLHRCTSHVLGR